MGEKDCAALKDLAGANFSAFQGTIRPVSPGGINYELSRPTAPFENCEVFLPKTSVQYPTLICDVMPQTRPDEQFVQSDAVYRIALETARTLATDMGRCLGVEVGKPRTMDFATRTSASWSFRLQQPSRVKETGLTPTANISISLKQALVGQTVSGRYSMPLLQVSLSRYDSATPLTTLAAVPSKLVIGDFVTLAGLSAFASEAEVVRVLGAPTRRRLVSTLLHLYYEDSNSDLMVSATVDESSGHLKSVSLKGGEGINALDALAYLKARKIGDPKANFLGRHRDDVRALFGKPNQEEAGVLEYQSTRGDVNVKVEFYCPDHSGYECRKLTVRWSK